MSSVARYGGFNHAGYSYKHQAALTAAYQVFPLTQDTPNALRSSVVPPFAQLQQVNFQVDTLAGGAAKVTFYLSRDAAGDIPVTGEIAATVEFGFTTPTKGTAIGCLDYDYHYTQTAPEVLGTLYLVAKLNIGTANANVLLHWRG
jgi:hypothetical protein